MISATFLWEPGGSDAEFERLNAAIDAVARANPGFVAAESWQATAGSRRAVVYYWRDDASLHEFARDPVHAEAKRQYARWYRGYHVVIAEVVRSYGDGAFAHLTPTDARR